MKSIFEEYYSEEFKFKIMAFQIDYLEKVSDGSGSILYIARTNPPKFSESRAKIIHVVTQEFHDLYKPKAGDYIYDRGLLETEKRYGYFSKEIFESLGLKKCTEDQEKMGAEDAPKSLSEPGNCSAKVVNNTKIPKYEEFELNMPMQAFKITDMDFKARTFGVALFSGDHTFEHRENPDVISRSNVQIGDWYVRIGNQGCYYKEHDFLRLFSKKSTNIMDKESPTVLTKDGKVWAFKISKIIRRPNGTSAMYSDDKVVEYVFTVSRMVDLKEVDVQEGDWCINLSDKTLYLKEKQFFELRCLMM